MRSQCWISHTHHTDRPNGQIKNVHAFHAITVAWCIFVPLRDGNKIRFMSMMTCIRWQHYHRYHWHRTAYGVDAEEWKKIWNAFFWAARAHNRLHFKWERLYQRRKPVFLQYAPTNTHIHIVFQLFEIILLFKVCCYSYMVFFYHGCSCFSIFLSLCIKFEVCETKIYNYNILICSVHCLYVAKVTPHDPSMTAKQNINTIFFRKNECAQFHA